ncbi:unnamed protein product [Vitrella brassicaformis CCMP3155]|uniref:Uncharacterized protein n=1 Tax=Vitrella brassicaformis (strain CCMP3155) TaxID=1169540 RepID=A0A0G4H3S1_VITBC|nr:unnamed protein product [Vitrella brassicaformis CCMP3155]|eukprot:CEM38370.1 unnamed protein product [Vitrella brassicaformis CCMP3155]
MSPSTCHCESEPSGFCYINGFSSTPPAECMWTSTFITVGDPPPELEALLVLIEGRGRAGIAARLSAAAFADSGEGWAAGAATERHRAELGCYARGGHRWGTDGRRGAG